MRWSAIAGEAWRNVRSGTALTVQLAALIGAITAAVIGFGAADIMAIAEQGAAYRASGANVLILQAPGAIDGAACEALNGTPGVDAGALRQAPRNLVSAVLPDSSVPTFEVTPGLATLIMAGRQQSPGSVLLSAAAADTIAAADTTAAAGTIGGADTVDGGGTFASPSGDVAVSGVYEYPDDGRRTDLAFAILVPTAPTTPFDECWVRTWPESPQLEALLRTSRIPSASGDDSSTLLQWNGTHGTSFSGQAMFENRVSRAVPAVAAVAAFVVALALARLRKVELASARHSGVTLTDQVCTLAIESASWIAAVIVVAVPVTCVFLARSLPGDATAYLQLGVTVPALASLGGLAGVTAAGLLSGERHLFRHVKGRR
jgi:hypothetical protein